jgi:CRP/FNR family transcriptional regulator, cyclic AMP receptor protein
VAPVTTIPSGSRGIDKSALLNGHPLFRQLAPEVRERIAAYATTREVERGKVIFTKGDPGTCLFAVCGGTVQVASPSATGKNAVLNLIREGEIFGEIALLDGGPRTADALAHTDCKLMVVDRRDFIPLLQRYPDVAIKMIEIICARLRHTTEHVEDLMFLDATTRLAKTLFRLSELAEPKGRIAITQGDLSPMVGLSREMINKQLGIWTREKWIRLERRRITVLRPDLLRQIATAD